MSSDSEGAGERDTLPLPSGRVLPLNSKRLTSAHLKQVARKLELPTTGSTDQVRQLIEGKLQESREISNVQVVVQESTYQELKLSLMDEEGVFLETDPSSKSVESQSAEVEGLVEALDDAKRRNLSLMEELEAATQRIEEEKERATDLEKKLEECEAGEGQEEVEQLKAELKSAKDKAKQLWKLTCSQSREQEERIADLEAEVARLRADRSREAESPSLPGSSSGRSSPDADCVQEPVRPTRRGKAPPVDSFTGEDPAVKLEDWLPVLKRASLWNRWSPEEELIQLAGHLRGRALQEWDLLRTSDRAEFETAVRALRDRLDPGGKAMAAQDFRHCSQSQGESVSDFIRRLERTFRLAYGRDGMLAETRDALLHGQLQEGLQHRLMEAPAVSGASTYAVLCQAAKTEERRQAELRKRRQYQSDRPAKKPISHIVGGKSQQEPERSTAEKPTDKKSIKCWNCDRTGHIAANCRKPRRESGGRSADRRPGGKVDMVQSSPARDDPMQYLQSDGSDDETEIRQVRVHDRGSKSRCVRVVVQGVPMYGIVDTAADITIMGGEAFKQVAAAAKLKKKDFKPPDQVPHNYDRRPFQLDGRVNLDIEFSDKAMTTPVYVKMDAHEQLLLSEGVCRQLEIISYHPEVQVFPPPKEKESGAKIADQPCQVPSVRVQLVKGVRVPPNRSVLVEAQLVGDTQISRGPLLLEPTKNEMGLRLVDEYICQSDTNDTAKVLLTNSLGITQHVREGTEIGVALPVEVVEAPPPPTHVLIPERMEQPTWNPDEALRPQSRVRVVTSARDRQKKLREMMKGELDDLSIPDAEKDMLWSLLAEFHDVFSIDGERGETDLVELEIDTGDSAPTRQPPRRVPFAVRQEIATQLKRMQEDKVIQPSNSPWASPIVLVKKKDGTLRFCIDYRHLNSVTKLDKFPLPRIDDLLDQLGQSQYFSTLDLAAGYWQVKVGDKSREKTAFITHRGLFEFRVMPFGLTNAPAIFQRLMQKVLEGLNPDQGPEFVEVYIDDVLVFSRTMEDHVKHLRQVLNRLRKAGLKLKPGKCHFVRQTVEYLGHVITPSGLQPNPNQVSAIRDYPSPESVTQVRQFLGMISYYRRFIEGFAKVASPLHSLTRKDCSFVWTTECQESFDTLKEKLISAPVLVYPNFSKPFVLETDASIRGLGAVLSQKQSSGKLHPVAFASRALSPPERNYSITELETLAVVWAMQHFRAYLYGHQVTVVTDHTAVKAILQTPSPNAKHARWWLKVFGSGVKSIDIVYRPGRENSKADALSRNPVPSVQQVHAEEIDISQLLEMPPQTQSLNDFHKEQSKDPKLRKIMDYLTRGSLPDDSEEAKKVAAQASQFAVVQGVLYFIDPKRQNARRAAVPSRLQHPIMAEIHGGVMSGHFAGNRLYKTLCRRWWWDSMYSDAISFCKNCPECAVVSGTGRVHRPPLHPIPVQRAFQILGVDIMELPVTERGNRYLIVFQDFLTKWPFIFAAPDQKAIRLVRLLTEEIVPVIGVPDALLSDRGTNLLSHLMQDVCQLLGVTKLNTTAYHPQCDGMIERLNRTLKAMIRKHVAKFGSQWDQYLAGVLWAYRNTPHEATQEKPSFLLFGVDCRSPTEAALLPPEPLEPTEVTDYREELVLSLSSARAVAVDAIKKAQGRYKAQYDRKTNPVNYRVGDWVLVRFPHEETTKQRKLSRPWHGPYRVTRRDDPDVTVVKVHFPEEGAIQVHQSRVCPCPPQLPAGFYWYGGRKKNPGRLPQWLDRLLSDQKDHEVSNQMEESDGDPQSQIETDEEEERDVLPFAQPLSQETTQVTERSSTASRYPLRRAVHIPDRYM